MPTVKTLNCDDHRHQLVFGKIEVPFFCDGCKVIAFGPGYKCPNKKCDFTLHEECGYPCSPLYHKFYKNCNFKFHKTNPLGSGTPTCDACALNIEGCFYQSSDGRAKLHPCCAKLPLKYARRGAGMEIHLSKKTKSKCLKCHTRKMLSGTVQGFSYVSSDGRFCYHVACMREAWLESWKNYYFKSDVVADDEHKIIVLQKFAPEKVAPNTGKISNEVKKWLKYFAIFLEMVVSAVIGEPFTLSFTLFPLIIGSERKAGRIES